MHSGVFSAAASREYYGEMSSPPKEGPLSCSQSMLVQPERRGEERRARGLWTVYMVKLVSRERKPHCRDGGLSYTGLERSALPLLTSSQGNNRVWLLKVALVARHTLVCKYLPFNLRAVLKFEKVQYKLK